MNEWMIYASAVAGYIAVGGVIARLLKGCDDEWVVPVTMFWPASLACLVVAAVGVLPYMATDIVIRWLTAPSIPKATAKERR